MISKLKLIGLVSALSFISWFGYSLMKSQYNKGYEEASKKYELELSKLSSNQEKRIREIETTYSQKEALREQIWKESYEKLYKITGSKIYSSECIDSDGVQYLNSIIKSKNP